MELNQILNNFGPAHEGSFVDRPGAGLGLRFIQASAMRQQNGDTVERTIPDGIIQWAGSFDVANIHIRALLDKESDRSR